MRPDLTFIDSGCERASTSAHRGFLALDGSPGAVAPHREWEFVTRLGEFVSPAIPPSAAIPQAFAPSRFWSGGTRPNRRTSAM